MENKSINPSLDCPLCPRLCDFRHDNQKAYPDFFNGPVPGFGNNDAKLLIVGLAPGLKGANRTGRPFTGEIMYCLAERFINAIEKSDEFTKREFFVNLGSPNSKTLSIKFKDGSLAHNTWCRIRNNIETLTYYEEN